MSRAFLIATLLLLFAVTPSGQAAPDGPVELIVETEWPSTNLHARKLELLAAEASRTSNRMLRITQRHNVPFRANLLRTLADASRPTLVQLLLTELDSKDPVLAASARPMQVASFAEARQRADRDRPAYNAALAKRGLKLLYVAPWPPSGIFTRTFVARGADLEQLDLRTYDRVGKLFFDAAGSSATALSYFQFKKSFDGGKVNAILTSSLTGVDMSLWERLRYFSRINYAFPLVAVVMRIDQFETLSANQRQALTRAAVVTESATWQAVEAEDAEALAYLTQKGVHVSAPTPSLSAFLRRVADRFDIAAQLAAQN